MGFFGIGAPEMVIILVVALIIFGPGKLPEVAGQAGKAVRDFRRMTSELTGEFEKTVNEAGAGDLKASLTGELTGMKSQVDSVSKTVQRDLNKAATGAKSTVSAATGTAAKSATKPATPKTAKPAAAKTSGGSATSAASAQPVATKVDPLADVSTMDDEEVDLKPVKDAPATAGAPGPSNGKAEASGNGVTPVNGASADANGSPALVPPDALARTRQRRHAAGYGAHRRT